MLNRKQKKKLQDREELSLNFQLCCFLKISKTLNHEEDRKTVAKLHFHMLNQPKSNCFVEIKSGFVVVVACAPAWHWSATRSDADSLNFHSGQADKLRLSSKVSEAGTRVVWSNILTFMVQQTYEPTNQNSDELACCSVTKGTSILFHKIRTYLFSNVLHMGKKPAIKSSGKTIQCYSTKVSLIFYFTEDIDVWTFWWMEKGKTENRSISSEMKMFNYLFRPKKLPILCYYSRFTCVSKIGVDNSEKLDSFPVKESWLEGRHTANPSTNEEVDVILPKRIVHMWLP